MNRNFPSQTTAAGHMPSRIKMALPPDWPEAALLADRRRII